MVLSLKIMRRSFVARYDYLTVHFVLIFFTEIQGFHITYEFKHT